MKPNCIELPDCEPFPILYEDRSVMAVDIQAPTEGFLKEYGFDQPAT